MFEGRLGRIFGRSPRESFRMIGSGHESFFNFQDMKRRRETLDGQIQWIKEQKEVKDALDQIKQAGSGTTGVTVQMIRDGREFVVELEESPTRKALSVTSKAYERDGVLYPERTEGSHYDPADNSLNIGSTFSFHGTGSLAVISDGQERVMKFNGQSLPPVFRDLQEASRGEQLQLQVA